MQLYCIKANDKFWQMTRTMLKKGLYFKLLLRSTLILVQGKGLSIKLALPMSDVSAIIK